MIVNLHMLRKSEVFGGRFVKCFDQRFDYMLRKFGMILEGFEGHLDMHFDCEFMYVAKFVYVDSLLIL